MSDLSEWHAEPLPEDVDAAIDEHVRRAVAAWPQIDPAVEGVSTRLSKAVRYLETEARVVLARLGLTKEEFKVLMALHGGLRSHGSLCRDLVVSTGAMTNRLDKLEHGGLIRRVPDPHDRRGVLLELTSAGRDRLDSYIEIGAARERELFGVLGASEKRELSRLLGKLLVSLQAEVGDRNRS